MSSFNNLGALQRLPNEMNAQVRSVLFKREQLQIDNIVKDFLEEESLRACGDDFPVGELAKSFRDVCDKVFNENFVADDKVESLIVTLHVEHLPFLMINKLLENSAFGPLFVCPKEVRVEILKAKRALSTMPLSMLKVCENSWAARYDEAIAASITPPLRSPPNRSPSKGAKAESDKRQKENEQQKKNHQTEKEINKENEINKERENNKINKVQNDIGLISLGLPRAVKTALESELQRGSIELNQRDLRDSMQYVHSSESEFLKKRFAGLGDRRISEYLEGIDGETKKMGFRAVNIFHFVSATLEESLARRFGMEMRTFSHDIALEVSRVLSEITAAFPVNKLERAAVKADWFNIKMKVGSSFLEYVKEFEMKRRKYEVLPGSERVSDDETVSKFVQSLNSRFREPATLRMAAMGDQTSFADFVSACMGIEATRGDQGHSAVDCNAIGGRRTISCWRCNEPGHFADTCESKTVFNADNRCGLCGMNNHQTPGCTKTLTENCRRCDKDGHVAAVCSEAEPVRKKRRTNNNFMTATLNNMGLEMEVGEDEDLEDIIIPAVVQNCEYQILGDTGAKVNFMSCKALTRILQHNGMNIHSVRGRETYEVRFGNTAKEVDCRIVSFDVTIKGQTRRMKFVVCRVLAYDIIIGMRGFRDWKMVLRFDGQRPMFELPKKMIFRTERVADIQIQASEVPDKIIMPTTEVLVGCRIEETPNGMLRARFPLYERAVSMPYSEKERNKSATDRAITFAILKKMEREEKLREISPAELHIVSETVLVDKKGGHRTVEDALSGRYRITADLRYVNQLRAAAVEGDIGLIADVTAAGPVKLSQYQRGADSILKGLLSGTNEWRGVWFAKIDVSDAFSSLGIADEMGKFFQVSCIDDNGVTRYFEYRVLPQGFNKSGMLFSRAVAFLVADIRLFFGAIKVKIDFFQDDIILVGECEKEVNEVMEMAIAYLGWRRFFCRKEKCSKAAPSTIFCGIRIEGTKMTPAPKAAEVTAAAVAASLADLKEGAIAPLKFLRHWGGVFNFCLPWLSPESLASLKTMQSFASPEKKFTTEDVIAICENFEVVARQYLAGFPGRFLAPARLCTLVACDSNCASWYAVSLAVVPVTKGSEIGILCEDFERDVLAGIAERLGVNRNSGFSLVPLETCGGVWDKTSRKKSSTFRERAALLIGVSTMRRSLEGQVFTISDNQNVGKTWQQIEEDLSSARLVKAFEVYQRVVDGHVWVKRDNSLARFVDSAARELDEDRKRSEVDEQDDESRQEVTDELVECFTIRASRGRAGTSQQEAAVQEDSDRLRETDVDVVVLDPIERLLLLRRVLTAWAGRAAEEEYLWLRRLQEEDPELQRARGGDEGGFVLNEEGVMFRKERRDFTGRTTYQLCVPDPLRRTVLESVHRMAGHPGHVNTANIFKQTFWCPKLRALSESVRRSCLACQAYDNRDAANNEVGEQRKATAAVWHEVSMDLVGPFVLTKNNNEKRWILTVVDSFTSFLATCVLAEITAEAVADGLDLIFYTYGFPGAIHSDRGRQFISRLCKAYCLSVGVRQRFSLAYTPHLGGYYEVKHRVINAALRRMSLGACGDREFEKYVAVARFQANSTEIAMSSVSPFILMLSNQPRLPQLNCSFENINVEEADLFKLAVCLNKSRTKLTKDIIGVWLDCRENTRREQRRQQRRMIQNQNIKAGDKFWIKQFATVGKLNLKKVGPFTALARRGNTISFVDAAGVLSSRNLKYCTRAGEVDEIGDSDQDVDGSDDNNNNDSAGEVVL